MKLGCFLDDCKGSTDIKSLSRQLEFSWENFQNMAYFDVNDGITIAESVNPICRALFIAWKSHGKSKSIPALQKLVFLTIGLMIRPRIQPITK